MEQKHVKEKLIFFRDQSLLENEMRIIQEHLVHCKECSLYLDRLNEDFATIQSEKLVSADPFYYTRLKAKMEQHEQLGVSSRSWAQVVVFSVLLIFAISGGIMLGKNFSTLDYQNEKVTSELLLFDGVKQEPIEQFLLSKE
jgi:predicted anti-sigma-YlaC factor YlaD